jgi:alanyl-tRNA synthetase
MTASEIRKIFLEFFREKQHQIVDSAPIVLKDDPTLMFTNAGMVQFKDYFLGNKEAINKRVTDTQKCLRVSGKHNDLEEVGVDTYHHTMFEMLGNWSFGDYFKVEAIAWSWELLTEVYKIPKDRLYVTIFEGDEKENIPKDMEAYAEWQKVIAEDRILLGNKKDNFWEMGDTGPCGPCTEIHVDMRPDNERAEVPGKDLVNNDHPQVIEIWNNVFIQFNRMANGSLQELPAKHVDTGMGFERLVRVIQCKSSNYDSDVFTPMIDKISSMTGVEYGKEERLDIAMRVIADHIRAISFTIADGQLPSNTGAGYVIRRILRRAVRYAYTFLGQDEPFIHKLVPMLADQFDGVFSELKAQEAFVKKVIEEEEISFLRTLNLGIKRLEQVIATGVKTIEGEVVFELYDTYGFPVDLTALIASENKIAVDEKGFQVAMEAQKSRSRKASESEKGDWITILDSKQCLFKGYDESSCAVKLLRYREVTEKNKTFYQVVTDQTPFYPEGGGQVGDKGRIFSDKEEILVFDTKKENDTIIHFCNKLPADLNASFTAEIKQDARQATTLNHSCTHLLQAGLKKVLGDHVAQKGSLVNTEVLRFDFAHFAKLSEEEIAQVEAIVNQKISEGILLDEKRDIPFADAQKTGAMALFGEKYGEKVRVITFDPKFSIELCGGTHVKSTAEIALFKIVSESSVAAGVRRIEALTGTKAIEYFKAKEQLLSEVNQLLKDPKDTIKALQSLLEEKNQLQAKLDAFEQIQVQQLKQSLESQVINQNGINYILAQVEATSVDSIKQIAFEFRTKFDSLVLVIGALVDGKPSISVMLTEDVIKSKGWNAGAMVRELAKDIQGGGGGQDFFATAGGKNADGLPESMKKAKALIELN